MQCSVLTWMVTVSCSVRYHSLIVDSLSDWMSSSVPCRVFSCEQQRHTGQHFWCFRQAERSRHRRSPHSRPPHLDHMLLAGLVLGSPLHRAALQVHGELRLGLTASKLRGKREGESTLTLSEFTDLHLTTRSSRKSKNLHQN